MADVVCLGELLIDFVPTVSGTGLAGAETFRKAAGGAPANVAVGLARLGVASAFMGKVGADPFGDFLRATLDEAGVDTTPLKTTDRARTALAFVSLRADGEREFLFYRDPCADALFGPEDVDEDAIAAARVLHFGSISLIAEPARAGTLAAIAAARRHGGRISCDPNLRLALWPSEGAARVGLKLALAEGEIVKISEEEVEFLTGDSDPIGGMRRLWHDRLTLVAVTRGRAGCVALTADQVVEVPGFTVDAVDATGAGDAFMAGLLAGLLLRGDAPLRGSDLAALCRFANAAGALTTTGRGAIPSLPTRAQVDRFMSGPAPSPDVMP
jgi:fructokinase